MKLENLKSCYSLTLFKVAFLIISFLILSLLFTNKVSALSWSYPYYNVDIEILEDTSFKVKESASFIFDGSLNGLRRDITLHDPVRDQYCIDNGDATCGGFEFLTINSVQVDGKKLSDDEYKIYEVKDEFTNKRSLRVEKRLYDEATYVTNEEHNWTIEYTVYGGIQRLKNTAGEEVPFFYWNVLPEDRGGIIESSQVTIKFPNNVNADYTKAFIYTYEVNEFYVNDDQSGLIFEAENLTSFNPITVSYEFLSVDLKKTASVEFEFAEPYYGKKVYFDDGLLPEDFSGNFNYVPEGKHKFAVERFGYKKFEVEVDLAAGEEVSIDVNLEPKLWMQVLLAANDILFALGIILVPVSIYYIYNKYKKHGKDEDKARTIIPLFQPPEDMKPYLIGSLKDEVVDKTDITGSIIDLAFRGFIQIKELGKKKYELIKKGGKEGQSLDWFETELMDILFDGEESVNLKDLTYTTINKLFALKSKIYDDMVSRGYFKKNPSTVRNIYYGFGITSMILGLIIGIGGTIFVSGLLGVNTIMTGGAAFFVLGIMMVAYAKYMPAKTKLGSQKYAEIQGFRMYLHAAERYRLKDLKPEEFEKFLSYAIVLGVEKEWAKSFEGIYNQQPSWYDGNTDVLDAYYWSRWARDFNNNTTTQFTHTVRSAGSHSSGGGWSGGGSFGGFSGGGGGGGSSGGW